MICYIFSQYFYNIFVQIYIHIKTNEESNHFLFLSMEKYLSLILTIMSLLVFELTCSWDFRVYGIFMFHISTQFKMFTLLVTCKYHFVKMDTEMRGHSNHNTFLKWKFEFLPSELCTSFRKRKKDQIELAITVKEPWTPR